MKNSELLVIVTARENVSLDMLISTEGPLYVPCGSIGPSLARQVQEGNGSAIIQAGFLAPAFDTTDGVRAMFDNFDFVVKDGLRPLIHYLIRF